MNINIKGVETTEQFNQIFSNLFSGVKEAVVEATPVVVKAANPIVAAVKKHAVAAASNTWDMTKEGAKASGLTAAAGAVYTTKHVAEATAKAAIATKAKAAQYAAWILAQ